MTKTAVELHALYFCLVTVCKKHLEELGFRTGAWGMQLKDRQC